VKSSICFGISTEKFCFHLVSVKKDVITGMDFHVNYSQSIHNPLLRRIWVYLCAAWEWPRLCGFKVTARTKLLNLTYIMKFVKPSKLKFLLNIKFVVAALSTCAVSFIAALKAWNAVACCMHRERWIPVPLWRNNITCFWHKSRSLFVTGWM